MGRAKRNPSFTLVPFQNKLKNRHQIQDKQKVCFLSFPRAAVRQYIEKLIDFSGSEITLKNRQHAVADRKVLAYYAAASLGERTDLVISLPDGYQSGDLVHVALPASLAWIQGGGKVKQFTRDFEGQDRLRIPLIVTSKIDGKQHFAVCVRNMFKEERASSLGMLTVEGKPV